MSDVDAELAKTNTDIMTKLNTATAEPAPSPAVAAGEPPAAAAESAAATDEKTVAPALAEAAIPVESKEPVAAEAKP